MPTRNPPVDTGGCSLNASNKCLKIVDTFFKQRIILIKKNGEQLADEMNCVATYYNEQRWLQYPKTIVRKNSLYILLKYSEKQNVVFYKLKENK